MDDLKRRSTAITSKDDEKDGMLDKETRLTRLKAQQIATGMCVCFITNVFPFCL